MDIKVNNIQSVEQTAPTRQVATGDDTFRFTLEGHIAENELQTRLQLMMEEITMQGKKLGKHMDIRDMKKYRSLVKEFMNEVVSHSHSFSRENYLDRKGRHRVYGMIRQVDDALDRLAQELVKEEQDNLAILNCVDEIRGLLLDIFT